MQLDDVNNTVYLYDDNSYVNPLEIQLSDGTNVSIINEFGEEVDTIVKKVINKDNPFINLKLKFNQNSLENYQYVDEDGGYYELKEPVSILIKIKVRTGEFTSYY